MPVDENDDERPEARGPEAEGDAPPKFTEAERDRGASPLTPRGRRARWRRFVNRRNAMWTGIAAVTALVALVIVAVLLYRTGQIDRIVARQIVETFSEYGVRAEIGSFKTALGLRTAELRDVKLYDAKTGAQLGKIDRILATVRVRDLYALSLKRNVDLESLELDGLELWVTFDEEGRSNFANLRLPEPNPNRRILFSYSTAHVTLRDAVVHYDDRAHTLSGEARNLRATVRPEDPNAPEESRTNVFEVALSDSTFVYDGRPVNHIDVEAKGRANQTRADIEELTLRSPVAEARLSGTMDDWRNLRYRLQVNATVDLTQASDVIQAGTTLRGTGEFAGIVSGEGDRYKVEGELKSESLAADGVRLQALNVNATGGGQGEAYEAQGRVVAELLTVGDFRINAVQLAGGVTGTGTNFRWLGELRAAALRSGQTSVGNLMLSDAVAEMNEGRLKASAKSASAGSVRSGDTSAEGVVARGILYEQATGGAADASAESASVASVRASGTNVSDVRAGDISAHVNADESADVTVGRVSVGGVRGAKFSTGSLNIAGVRLSVSPAGAVEGTTGDVAVGTVALAGGDRVENVRLTHPAFRLEPSGSYRASADLSLGGGVLGQMPLGSVRGHAVVTTTHVELNDFVADIFNGSARGSARLATAPRGASQVKADFEGVDVGGLISAFYSGRVVPLTGAATGNVNLSFPGQDYRLASGTLNAHVEGQAGQEAAGRTPLTGDVALTADRGQFQIEKANFVAGATELNARGRLSIAGGSDLSVSVASRDASELQRLVVSTGLVPALETQLGKYAVQLAGALGFEGTVAGDLKNPLVNGHFSLASLSLRGRNVGGLEADIASNDAETRVENGRLEEPDGGGVSFTAVVPRAGENNISVEATLENANAGNLLAALGNDARTDPDAKPLFDPQSLAGLGPASGRLTIRGLPGAMSGDANLTVDAGNIAGEPYKQIAARASFSGTRINVESLTARFDGGSIEASGNVDSETQDFDLNAKGEGVRLDLLARLFGGGRSLPPVSGVADFTATASGNLEDKRSYRVELDARGRDVTVNGRPAGDLTLVGHTTPDNKFTLDLTTGIFGQPQVVRAEVDLSNDELPLTFETSLAGVDLTPLFRVILGRDDVTVTGRATGTVRAGGKIFDEDTGGFSLSGRAEFTELSVEVEDVPLTAENPLVVTFTPTEVSFEQTRFTGPGTDIRFGGTAAVGAGGRQDATVNGTLNLRVVKLSPNTFLGGTARVGVRLTGSYEDPTIVGTAEVAGGSFATLVQDQRLQVSQVNARVRFNADQAEIETMTGRLGGGRISVTGGALLNDLQLSQYRFAVRGENVTVPFPRDFRTTADADLELTGTMEGQLVRGLVRLRRTEYTQDVDLADFIDRRGELSIEEGGGGVPAFGLGQMSLDLQVEGRDALVVRNNLGDFVGSVSLRAVGPADDPIYSGRVTATRGQLNFRNNRFEIQRAIVDLPPRREIDPVLNVIAESEIRGYRVRVAVTGPLSGGMQTLLSSDPPLPQGDIVSLITRGDLASGDETASVLSQTGVGTATSLLTDTLINAPVRRATDKLFGLNRFEIDPLIVGRGGASPTARLTVGRQINRNLTVTYSTNVTGEPNQVLALEYRVSDRLSFVAQYRQGSQNTLRTQNNDFSFEVRFRKRY